MSSLELWGGMECTINRVGDRYVDQLEKNGHYKRISDLSMISELGIKKVRYPCLWEKVAPNNVEELNWSFLDERLEELRRLGISPIAGFLHHGSGPQYTSLIDEDFPEKLAKYAQTFAERYPWIEDYTPVNEILTTSRFSCLYGHWYPHTKDHSVFIKALFNQVKGTILAMRAIRKVNPSAKLLQTDDLGKAQGTSPLQYQVDFENERRWLGWDLLCGKVDNSYPLADYLKLGASEEDMKWIRENPCPPDYIGINHYHLSNRFLDHRMDLYPAWSRGGNGKDQYADIGAVDTGQAELPSPENILMEAWQRYQIPIVVSEVHTMGHRDSQMRWLYQMWSEAKSAQKKGAQIKAITVWSLLGTYDWHKLCTACEMFYEPGVFDLRSPGHTPQKTGLSQVVKDLATKGDSDHPILSSPGWWKTPRRILWASPYGAHSLLETDKKRPILITGATGTLGQAFARICGSRNIPYRLLKRSHMDIADFESVRATLKDINPWAVINTAGYVKVDLAEDEQEQCYRENVFGAENLARACAERDIPLISFSTDMVFDGSHTSAYHESHEVNPLNIYGISKAESERRILEIHPSALIIRTSSFFGPWDEYNFITGSLRLLAAESEIQAAHDMIITPTYVPDLAHATLDLLLDGEKGIIHLTNKGEVSWADFAKLAVESAKLNLNLDTTLIQERSWKDLSFRAKRPLNSALSSERFTILPSLENAMERYFKDLEIPIRS
jgi:dTDP-4-dehydrorhamnose reductase